MGTVRTILSWLQSQGPQLKIFFFFSLSSIKFSDDDSGDMSQKQNRNESSLPGPPVGPNPFLDIPQNVPTVEYKKGYVMRKCCVDSNNKKSKFGCDESSGVGWDV